MNTILQIKPSSNIKTATFDYGTKVLTVTFKSGIAYSYKDVPVNIADDFAKAESPGSYFASNIKGKYSYANSTGVR